MTEISEKVKLKIIGWIKYYIPSKKMTEIVADKILAIPELAVVDRGEPLPENPYYSAKSGIRFAWRQAIEEYKLKLVDWIKEIKE